MYVAICGAKTRKMLTCVQLVCLKMVCGRTGVEGGGLCSIVTGIMTWEVVESAGDVV